MKSKFHSRLIWAASVIVAYAQALTGGRMGYGTWIVVGLLLCSLRWRKYLLIAPFLVFIVVLAMPGIADRMLQGFSSESRDYNSAISSSFSNDEEGPDSYTITSGRTFAWPYVIAKIHEAPLWGFGRLAMLRTGIASFLWEEYGEEFPHPHNAYLELLLDNGWVGFLLVVPFYLMLLKKSFVLFLDTRSPVCSCIGGVSSALVLALLVASFGSQTFYPREGAVGMWCAIGLMLRVFVERDRVAAILQKDSGQAIQSLVSPSSVPHREMKRKGQEYRFATLGELKSVGTIDALLWNSVPR